MRIRSAVAFTALAVCVLSSVGAGAAISAPSMRAADHEVALTFSTPDLTIEYGDGWGFELYSDQPVGALDFAGLGVFPDITGAPGYNVGVYLASTYHTIVAYPVAYLNADPNSPPLRVGEYTIGAAAEGNYFGDSTHGYTAPPGHLTITRAPLGLSVRVVPDPNNPEGAIVTALFTGHYVDNFYPSADVAAPVAPEGAWTITLTDADGEVGVQRNFERQATDDVLSTTFYWLDAKPGMEYTATAVFEPAGASATNFNFSEATPFAYTAVEPQRPVPTSTAAAAPPSEVLPDPGFGLPAVVVILGVVLIVISGVLTTIFAVKGSRRMQTGAAEGGTANVPSL